MAVGKLVLALLWFGFGLAGLWWCCSEDFLAQYSVDSALFLSGSLALNLSIKYLPASTARSCSWCFSTVLASSSLRSWVFETGLGD